MTYPISSNVTLQRAVPGRRLESGVLKEIKGTIQLDRAIHATRFNTLISDYRPDDSGRHGPWNYVYSTLAGADIQALVIGATFQVPNVLPGTPNKQTAGTGTTVATRGALHIAALIEDCKFTVRIREISSTLTSLGLSTTTTLTNATTTMGWVSGYCLLPESIEPGDFYFVDILYTGGEAEESGMAKVKAFVLHEPILTAV
jgi:hypothetical protein